MISLPDIINRVRVRVRDKWAMLPDGRLLEALREASTSAQSEQQV